MTLMFHSRRVSKSKSADYLRGASTILNIRGRTSREYEFAESDAEADMNAMADDWNAIGGDLQEAMDSYRRNAK